VVEIFRLGCGVGCEKGGVELEAYVVCVEGGDAYQV